MIIEASAATSNDKGQPARIDKAKDRTPLFIKPVALISDWLGWRVDMSMTARLTRIGTTETLPAGGFLFYWSAVGHHQRNKMENTGNRV
ncbi:MULTISPECIES: hypothetical protein [Rhizobium/Agrobacterium group]|uniref:hypothetical protein n=1 Tax=Rhizobium/Agrobacterium group TaxID=227290 RepID=UPI002301E427|nr:MULTISPECIES: hypothetical protein [Rhizobium/Agrobacterium group]MDA5635431.1 hypothetical protein [Agrobacterium sp. ST15.16.024]MDF1890364.1 hypothetical protein [Rhizobium rhizogenes]